jgi:hypothetical protein
MHQKSAQWMGTVVTGSHVGGVEIVVGIQIQD